MIKLPDKGKCKRKDFTKAMQIGLYVTIDFMEHKRSKYKWCSHYDQFGNKYKRNMETRPKIFKIIDRNTLELMYLYNNKENKWKSIKDQYDPDYENYNFWYWSGNPKKPTKYIYRIHNLWSLFMQDGIRNVCVMTKEELLEKYMWELL